MQIEINMNIVYGVIILSSVRSLYRQRQIRRARERGLWPPLGQIPTDADVARLAKAGEKILAVRMLRQLYNLDLDEATTVVDKLAEPSTGDNEPSIRQ